MVKTTSGEKISLVEAFKRFRQGVKDITPIQKLQTESRGTFITLLGFIISFFAVIYLRNTIGLLAYGLVLIFLGSIITTGLKYIGMKQQLKYFKQQDSTSLNVEEIIKSMEEIK